MRAVPPEIGSRGAQFVRRKLVRGWLPHGISVLTRRRCDKGNQISDSARHGCTDRTWVVNRGEMSHMGSVIVMSVLLKAFQIHLGRRSIGLCRRTR